MAIVINDFEAVAPSAASSPGQVAREEPRAPSTKPEPREIEKIVRRAAERALRVRAY